MVYEFAHEIKSEPREFGFALVKASMKLKGQVLEPQQQRSPTERVVVSKDALKRGVETKFWDTLTIKFQPKASKELLEHARENLKNPSPAQAERFFKEFLKGLVELESTTGLPRWEPLPGVVAETAAGLQLDVAPVFFKVKGTWKDKINLPHTMDFAFAVDGTMNFGLSKRAWQQLATRSKDAVQLFLRQAGPSCARMSAWLVSSGVLAGAAYLAAGIAGTLGLIALTASVTAQARRRGAIRGLEAWYVSGYSNRVFNLQTPQQRWWPATISNAAQLAADLHHAGEKDALEDARRTARFPYADPDADTASEDAILRRHRARLERVHGGSTAAAKHYLEQELRKQAQGKLGASASWWPPW